MIVDDHAVVRGGLSNFLQVHKDLELVGEAENGVEAVRRAQQLLPDVVLMDLKMPEMDGVAATREIRARNPKVRVIVLTSFAEDNMVQGALQAGATGYLLKNVTGAELAHAIRAAHAGRMTLSSEATEALVHAATHPIVPADELTEREREVLALMVDGLSNQEIANRLFLSLGTVKFHTGNIYSKLGVDSRVAAVTLAIQRRLV
ncbi:MAG: response regulator transcription factor [Caldilineaceae bacterium]|nr:response regulator transcription factor [Caldilineaceae bacterium]